MGVAYEADLSIRITQVYESKKKNDPTISLRGVRVNKDSHSVESKIDYYSVKLRNTVSPEPSIGEIWHVTGMASVEEAPSFDGNYIIKNHTVAGTKAELILSQNPIGFKSFIASTKHFKGIGTSMADKLWRAFGSDIYSILKNKDKASLLTVKGISDISAESLITGFKKFAYLKYAPFFTEKEIPIAIQNRMFKFKGLADGSLIQTKEVEFSRDPKTLIENDPYSLSLFGLPFAENDKIAKKHFNIKDNDPRRLIAAVTQTLREHNSKGNTIGLRGNLMGPLKKMLLSKDLAEAALSVGYDKRAFVVYPGTDVYQFTPTYIMENVVALRLLNLQRQGEMFGLEETIATRIAMANAEHPIKGQQQEAVLSSVSYAVSCVTGGAGTGKTTVLNTILRAYDELGYDIKAVALSGRAAMRMRQSIRRPSSTIAKFLREPALDNEEIKQLLVIDESSMVDLISMYKLVLHTSPTVRILFVGDPNQLPSIGAGNILADIVKSKIIVNTELDIVKRQGASSGIPEYSKLINTGVVPPMLTTGAITFHDTEINDVAQVCVELFQESPGTTKVVAPTNGLVGEINILCQKAVNTNGERLSYELDDQYHEDVLCKNDPVLFTQNNYDVGVQNGSLGKLISIEQRKSEKPSEDNQNEGVTRCFGVIQMDDFEDPSGEYIEISQAILETIQPGYAITLHKGQGSQFPRVIVALTNARNVDRAWLYTAITRAEVEIHIVGPKSKFISATKNLSNASKRLTYLQELLKSNNNHKVTR